MQLLCVQVVSKAVASAHRAISAVLCLVADLFLALSLAQFGIIKAEKYHLADSCFDTFLQCFSIYAH